MFYKISSVLRGISIGAFVSMLLGLMYLVVLREPGSAFYPFAGLVFLVGPLIGGIAATWKMQEHQRKAFFISSSVTFGIVLVLFIISYLVLPLFDRVSVQLPEVCDEDSGSFNPPPALAYTLPNNVGTGVLITVNAQFALVAVIDYKYPPFPSTVFLVNKSDNRIIKSMAFDNDIISAAIDGDTLYLYNDKLGYFIDARTGELESNLLTMDNYGGLSESDRPIISAASSGHWYMETTAVISSWNVDGSVKSRRYLTFNGIALGCFINGNTNDFIALK
jgi:hypothetical protein